MKDEDDPYLAVAKKLTIKNQTKIPKKLEELFDILIVNIISTAYIVVAILILLLILSPLLLGMEDSGLRGLGALFHVGAGLIMICHQLPYRSLVVNGIPSAVCARDLGIYFGAVVGFATVYLRSKPELFQSIRMVVIGVVPIAIDGVTQSILHLRESNNILRLATGLIFGFFIMAYLSNRWLTHWYPKIRKQVIETKLIIVDISIAVALLYILISGFGQGVGLDYMSQHEAIDKGIELSTIAEPVDVRAYYVPSNTVFTITKDPFFENHKGHILSDIYHSELPKQREAFLRGDFKPSYPGARTPKEFLQESANSEHKYGIWAVGVFTSEPLAGTSAYVQHGPGQYFYFDPITRELIWSKNH